MTYDTAEVMRAGLDTTTQFGQKMRTNPAAVSGARNGHVQLQSSMNAVKTSAGTQRVNLSSAAEGNTADRATGTSESLEKEVQDLLEESAEIESAVARAAEALDVGQIKNAQTRDAIIKDIDTTMKAVAATKQMQPPEAGQAAARKLLTDLMGRIQKLTGVAATNAEQTINELTDIGTKLGRDGATTASSATDTKVASQFNSQGGSGHSGGGGGGGDSGGGGGGGGGSVTKPRLPVAIPPQPGTGVAVNLPNGKTVQAPNETAAKAVRSALSQLGVPYVWGGTARDKGLDCSGLTMTSYGEAGLAIPRTAAAQTVGAEVPSMDQLLPGDLVVWSGHVAMVIGDGQMVEAGDPVEVSPIRTTNAGQSFIGFYRPTG
jgi:cell wall-associated NlpC family hydrolase